MFTLKVLFVLFALIIIYTYFIYFIVLKLLARHKHYQLATPEDFIRRASELTDPAGALATDDLKTITIIIPAFNEERIIREKMENCLWLSYKREKLEIIVASDGSDDRTNEIVRQYAANDPAIKLFAYPVRRGKTAVLNDAIPKAVGEIIVLCDASSLLSIDSLQMLARHFYDEKIGCVSGTYKLVEIDQDTHGSSEGAYWRYETAIKASQGKLQSLLGAHGALYAFLKKTFQPLPTNAINDDYLISARIMAQGYKAVYEVEAVGLELARSDRAGEFKRRVRIMAGNFQQVAMLKYLLHPRHKQIAFHFISHKVLRLLVPFLMLLLLAINIPLALHSSFFRVLLYAQGLFYLCALLGYVLERRGLHCKLFYIAFYFNLINLSTFFGFYRYLLGKQSVKWERVDK